MKPQFRDVVVMLDKHNDLIYHAFMLSTFKKLQKLVDAAIVRIQTPKGGMTCVHNLEFARWLPREERK